MKDKLKPIDVSIISEYMGRFQTVIVALLVAGLTAHALVTRGSARGHVTLVIAANGNGELYRPLSRLVAARTGRSVTVVESAGATEAELFVMPSLEFIRRREELDLVPLFGLSETPGDRAVIVAAGVDAHAPERADDVLFSSPGSVNGCWVQLHALFRRQASLPASVDSLRFGGGDRYVAWAVHSGVARYGACRASDLDGIDLDRVTVVFQTPALPDQIMASRTGDRQYFLDRLGELGAAVDAPSSEERDLVELLRARGVGCVRPVSAGQLKELEAVFQLREAMAAPDMDTDAGSP